MGIVDNRVWQIRWTHVSQPILEHGRGYYFGIWQWCHYGWCRPDPYFFMKILTTFFTYRCLPSDDLFSCRLVTPPTFRPRLSGVLSKFSHNFLKFYLGVTGCFSLCLSGCASVCLLATSHTRGVQKVLQLLYKKEPQTFKHSVIFEYSLLQHQCSFVTFLLSYLFLEKKNSLSCP